MVKCQMIPGLDTKKRIKTIILNHPVTDFIYFVSNEDKLVVLCISGFSSFPKLGLYSKSL